MIRVGPCGSAAVVDAAKHATVLRRRLALRNLAVAETFRRLLDRRTILLRLRPRGHVLPHVPTEAVLQCGGGIRHSVPMGVIVGPNRGSMHIADIYRVEVVAMEEGVVDNHGAVAPAGLPAPTIPSAPSCAEEGTDVDASVEPKSNPSDDHAGGATTSAGTDTSGAGPRSKPDRNKERKSPRDRPAGSRYMADRPGFR